jgi:threonine/homoserine/homoserine lactone efflux protein
MLLVTFIKGIVIGLVIALPVGPVGLLSVRRTLFEGAWFGLASGLGATCADTVFGVIAGFGLTYLGTILLGYQDLLGAWGGAFLVAAGAHALFSDTTPQTEPLAGEALAGTFLSAFALTLTNPITVLSFTMIFAKVGLDSGADAASIAAIVAGVFAGSAFWWMGLTAIVAWLRRRTGGFAMARLNRASGAILILAGAGLLVAATIALWRR